MKRDGERARLRRRPEMSRFFLRPGLFNIAMDTNRHGKTAYGAGGTTLEPLPSIDETRAILGGVSTRTVIRLLNVGELVRVRVRGRTLVDPDSIRDYIARHREEPAP